MYAGLVFMLWVIYMIAANDGSLAERHMSVNNGTKLENSTRTQQLLAELKKIPYSEYEKNRVRYKELVDLHPNNQTYKSKLQTYSINIAKENTKKSKPTSGSNYQSKMYDYVLEPYTREGGYSKTLNKFGTRISELEKYRKIAAYAAIDSGKCDKVYASDISDRSTLDNLQFFVDCDNDQRFRFTEAELKRKGGVAKSEEEKAWSKSNATAECQTMVKANARFPSTVDFHWFTGTSSFKAQMTGNVVVSINFDAKNSLGNELSYTARCVFQPSIAKGEITIVPR
jgi:hypothetical protein